MEANLLRTTCVTVSITVEVQKISKYLWIQTKRGSEKKYKGTNLSGWDIRNKYVILSYLFSRISYPFLN